MPRVLIKNRLHDVVAGSANSIAMAAGSLALTGRLMVEGRGPQASISPPGGSVVIAAGSTTASRQTLINANSNGTSFSLAAGVHTAEGPNTPKTGNTFTGVYGAILDGTNWPIPVPEAEYHYAAFMAHNQDIDDVTIRNLTIRNMPRYAVKAYPPAPTVGSNRWIVDHCDIIDNVFGVGLPNESELTNCHILRNIGIPNVNPALNGGGYITFNADTVLIENNELYANGPQTKVQQTANAIVRGNWFHDADYNGIWFDGDNFNSICEDNIVEDTPIYAIFIEISVGMTVRRNTVRRAGWVGINLHTSRETDVYENVIEDCGVGYRMLLDCAALGGGANSNWDLTNNTMHDNTIVVNAGQKATGLYTYACTTAQGAEYLSNAKNNNWTNNVYDVPNPASGQYWFWTVSTDTTLLTWAGWQAEGQDLAGSVS